MAAGTRGEPAGSLQRLGRHPLDAAELERLDTYRRQRLGSDRGWSELDFTAYFTSLGTLLVQHATDARACGLLDALDDWGRQIEASLRD